MIFGKGSAVLTRSCCASAVPVALAVAATAPISAQSRPTGHVSVQLDHFPSAPAPATELRPRIFAEQTLAPSRHLRIVLAGYLEALGRKRDGRRRMAAIVQPQEVAAEVSYERFDVRAGMSRITWGRLDEVPPSDIVNPLDVSRFFFQNRSEARLPVPLVRARAFITTDESVEIVYVPVFRRAVFDQLDEATSPFNVHPLTTECDDIGLCPRGPVERHEPATSLRNAQGGVRFHASTGRLDWTLSGYRGFRSAGVLTVGETGLEQSFPRFTMLAADFESATQRWAFRGEVAAFVRDVLQTSTGPARGSSLDAGVGVDRRAGSFRLSGSLVVHNEAADPQPSLPVRLAADTSLTVLAAVERSFARERYTLRLFSSVNVSEPSGFTRGVLTWKLNDATELEWVAGWFEGNGTDSISRFADRDFVYGRLKFYF